MVIVKLNASDTILIDVINLPYSINTIAHDSMGTIWLTGALGLQYFDYEKDRFITTDPSFKSKILSEHGSIVRFHTSKKQEIFPWHRFEPWLSQIPDDIIRITVARDKYGRFWVSTGFQIYIYSIENRFDQILPGYSTRGIFKDGEHLYIHTYRGIFKNSELLFDKPPFATGDIKKFGEYLYFVWSRQVIRYQPAIHKPDNIEIQQSKELITTLNRRTAICMDQIGDTIWVGTTFGLGYLDEDSVKMVSKHPSIQDILPFKGGGIIVASKEVTSKNKLKTLEYLDSGGIYLRQNGQFQKLPLPQLDYHHILEMNDKYYMASDSGVVVWNGDKVTSFITVEDGLSDNRTCNLAFDKEGFLWVSTFSGLNRINLESGKITQYLKSMEFNYHSVHQQDSMIYMGSVDGVYVFNPRDFLGDDIEPVPSWKTKHYLILTVILLIFISIFIYFYFRQQNQQKLKRRDTKIKEMEKKIFLLQIEQIIINNDLPISTSTLAHVLDISDRTLYRKFKKFELTPGNYLKELKIKRAKFLLNNTLSKFSINEVAEMVGYSESYLQKLLKEEAS